MGRDDLGAWVQNGAYKHNTCAVFLNVADLCFAVGSRLSVAWVFPVFLSCVDGSCAIGDLSGPVVWPEVQSLDRSPQVAAAAAPSRRQCVV